MNVAVQQAARAVLEWYQEQGVDLPLDMIPVNRVTAPALTARLSAPTSVSVSHPLPTAPLMATSALRAEAVAQAATATNLQELAQIIRDFDGLAIRKTATNMVFADGNPKAHVMVIGEDPGAEEDMCGKPFVGPSGHLLDKMLAAIGLSRQAEDPAQSVYITNLLNWRPPGNRTPSQQEIDISLPFLERHVALVQPKLLFVMGGVASKSLLNNQEGIMKIRGQWAEYRADGRLQIPALPSFHPSFLLRNPIQKKAAWVDLLSLKEKLIELNQ